MTRYCKSRGLALEEHIEFQYLLGHHKTVGVGRVNSYTDIRRLLTSQYVIVFDKHKTTYRRSKVRKDGNDVAFHDTQTMSICRQNLGTRMKPVGLRVRGCLVN